VVLTAREAGESIKPRVERSGTPGMIAEQKSRVHEVGDSAFRMSAQFCAVARFARCHFFSLLSWGSALLHPQALWFHPLRGFEQRTSEPALDNISVPVVSTYLLW
jgi:hypothetical protein